MAPADLWQLTVYFCNNEACKEPTVTYFLVRWLPPYRFQMVKISERPTATCRQEDPEADADHTLFAGEQRY